MSLLSMYHPNDVIHVRAQDHATPLRTTLNYVATIVMEVNE